MNYGPYPLNSLPVVIYDGENAEAVLKALDLEVGDGVVVVPDGRSIVMKSSTFDNLRNAEVTRWGIAKTP